MRPVEKQLTLAHSLVEEKDNSDPVVRTASTTSARSPFGKKQKFLAEDPGEDVTMPISEKPVMAVDLMLLLRANGCDHVGPRSVRRGS